MQTLPKRRRRKIKGIMKKSAKLIVILGFSLGVLFIFLSNSNFAGTGLAGFPQASQTPTPSVTQGTPNVTGSSTLQPSQTTIPSKSPTISAANSKTSVNASPAVNKDLCTLNENGEEGVVRFDHDSHAFIASYSADGISPAGCVVCHHTDKPPERSAAMTFALWKDWKGIEKKVKNCKDCHFPLNDIPEGKEMLVFKGKDYDNETAYHENCTVCHAQAALRPAFKPKSGFVTKISGKECGSCHR